MIRSGDDYMRGLRDGRTVLFNGERVADVPAHPAFAAGVRTVRGNQSNRDFPTELRAEPLDLRALVSILV